MIRRYSLMFAIAFVLNLVWENAHSILYANYQGGVITEPILLRATLFDAFFITTLFLLIDRLGLKKFNLYIQVGVSFLVAVLIEVFALSTGRWMYTAAMPLIPILQVGIFPVVQLPLLGFVSGLIVSRILRK